MHVIAHVILFLRLLCAQIGIYTVQRHRAEAVAEAAEEAAWAQSYAKPQWLGPAIGCYSHKAFGLQGTATASAPEAKTRLKRLLFCCFTRLGRRIGA